MRNFDVLTSPHKIGGKKTSNGEKRKHKDTCGSCNLTCAFTCDLTTAPKCHLDLHSCAYTIIFCYFMLLDIMILLSYLLYLIIIKHFYLAKTWICTFKDLICLLANFSSQRVRVLPSIHKKIRMDRHSRFSKRPPPRLPPPQGATVDRKRHPPIHNRRHRLKKKTEFQATNFFLHDKPKYQQNQKKIRKIASPGGFYVECTGRPPGFGPELS